ncbi:MAG: hypothetical protein ACLQMH_04810 [Solirubrobacteraceae bacterium]
MDRLLVGETIKLRKWTAVPVRGLSRVHINMTKSRTGCVAELPAEVAAGRV